MAVHSGSPWRGLSKCTLVNVGTSAKEWWVVNADAVPAGTEPDGNQALWDHGAGDSLTLRVEWFTTGAPTYSAPDRIELKCFLPGTSTQVGQSYVFNPRTTVDSGDVDNGYKLVTFHFDDDPLAGGLTSARAGMLEIYLRVAWTGTGAWDTDSRDGGSPPVGPVDTNAVGYWRARSTLVSETISNVAIDGAEPATWAFDEPIHVKAVLDAATYRSNELTVALRDDGGTTVQSGVVTSSGTDQTKSWTATGDKIDNSFDVGPDDLLLVWPARTFDGDQEYVWAASGHDADFARESETVLADVGRMNVDPRLTVDHHLQIDTNTLDPASDDPLKQRLPGVVTFVGFRIHNAVGTYVNGITATEVLQDANDLFVAAVNRSVTTTTVNTHPGSTPLTSWNSTEPGGAWDHDVTITAPSHATGLEVTSNATYTLLVRNPNYLLVCGGGPAGANEGDHFHAGEQLQVGLVIVSTKSNGLVILDSSPAPNVVLGRFTAGGRVQYLDADGVTWTELPDGGSATSIPLMQANTLIPTADPRVWLKIFPPEQTAQWTEPTDDFFVIGEAYVNGTPYSNYLDTLVVGKANGHAGYTTDAVGLALHGILSQR